MENGIYHYGVKGMKWGVRRTPAQLGHKVPKRSFSDTARIVAAKAKVGMSKAGDIAKSGMQAAKAKQADKPKAVKNMTMEELQQRINRLNMERNYRNLLAEQKSAQTSAVQKFVSKQFGNLASKVADKAITKAVDKIFRDVDKTKSVLDVSKMDQYTDKEIEAAKKRKDNIRDILSNWDKVKDTNVRSFYGQDSYQDMVEAGKGAVQEALKRMDEDK